MNLEEIQSLIKFVSKSGAEEVELETKDIKITIKTPSKKKGRTDDQPQQIVHQMPVMPQQPMQQPMQQPTPQGQPQAPAQEQQNKSNKEESADDSKYITVKSPMIGTFYRRPSPDKDVFIEVGDSIKEGDVTCIIEAMKLFNEIESEVSGKIVKILAEDSSPVEYDQPLFLVDPS